MKKILLSFVLITLVAAGAIKASSAFFSDTETSTGNILQAGMLDLLIDNTSYYNGVLNEATSWLPDDLDGTHFFFNFNDLKPDDWGEDTISLHVNDNEAWACMDINMTKNDDNGSTEPELLVDTADDPNNQNDGELAQNLNFVFWVDDGDNVLEDNEAQNGIIKQGNTQTVMDGQTWTLADSTTNLFGETLGRGLLPTKTYYIGKAWCFGTLGLAPLTQDNSNNTISPATTTGGITCDGTLLGNETQTDIVNADVKFEVEQHRNNPNFRCVPPPVISCTTEDVQHASTANPADNDQGLRKNNTAVLPDRSVLSYMFGAPQTAGNDSEVAPANSFFSLGFPLQGNTASIVLGFAQPFYNDGTLAPDLQVFEVTGGTYPDEKVKIEASKDGSNWTLLAASAVRDEAVDLATLDFANYVRLTDVSDINLFEATADGYDVDAVKTFCRASALDQ